MSPSADIRGTLLGLRTVVLENRTLRVTVLPEVGGRVWSIVYKPLDRELLWQNPRVSPRKVPFGSCYDDVWCGGWDELFPTDVAGFINGEKYPDHGEVWTIDWDAAVETSDGTAAVVLRCQTPISAFQLERKFTLREDEPVIYSEHRITNASLDDFPFLWKMHPAFRVSGDCRIDFPPMTVELEPTSLASLAGAPLQFPWPYADTPQGRIDLRQIPPSNSKLAYFYYGTGYREGWCAITDVAAGLSYGLTFSPEDFPSCWLFASFGGWRNHNVAVIEPSTTYPFEIEKAIERGTARTLAAGASLATHLTLQVATGLSRVSGISNDGRFVE